MTAPVMDKTAHPGSVPSGPVTVCTQCSPSPLQSLFVANPCLPPWIPAAVVTLTSFHSVNFLAKDFMQANGPSPSWGGAVEADPTQWLWLECV